MELTQEQVLFRDMAKEFSRREIAPTVRDNDRAGKFPSDLIKMMGDQGLCSIMVPKVYGGLELDWTTMGLVAEQFAAVDFSAGLTFFVQTSLAEMPIIIGGDEAQKKKFLPGMGLGKIIGCTAAVEPNVGSDATAVETKAVLDGDSWVLNGNKTWITTGSVADVAVVMAAMRLRHEHADVLAQDVRLGVAEHALGRSVKCFDVTS